MKQEAFSRFGIFLVTALILAAFSTGFIMAGRRAGREPGGRPPVVMNVPPVSRRIDLSLEREKERSRLKEELERMLPTAGEDLAKKIKNELWELTLRAAMEKEMETLLAARGYRENIVVIHPQAVTIVVKGADLTPAQAAAIGQLAAEITGFPLEQIRIIE